MIRFIIQFTIVLAILDQCSSAQTLISKLPDDGVWATYSLCIETTTADGEISEIDGELTVRVVGTESDDTDILRWIEIDQTMALDRKSAARADADEIRIVDKILVSENDIGRGKDPVSSLRKIWRHHSQDELPEPKSIEPNSRDAKLLHVFLPTPMRKTQQVENKRIETTTGVLNCSGVAGMDRVSQSGGFESSRLTTTYSHDESPFGAVSFKSIAKTFRDDQRLSTFAMTIVLESTGTDATSSFPDKN